ncbi:Serine/threonine-protein kinase MARK2 [Myotis brandtii]|uniref:non-specific serine/threonine protein kinase n=1 Tax=Myotis brandtii TaxID=109478 RepID=S7NQV1_MYOBR|nr:Serine/threonine-protein kinase MARK2 [Myotis brandtii]
MPCPSPSQPALIGPPTTCRSGAMFNAFAAHSTVKERCIGDYLLLHTIGKGCYAEVRVAQHLLTRAQVVVKAIKKQGISRFFQEVHCFKSLNHPNITQLFEVIATQDKFFLAMEHVSGGDLLEHLQNYGTMNEGEARAVFRQVVSAVQYCHQRGIVHRDLKPDNILIDGDMTIKLADFGFSREVSDDKQNTFCGTVCYSAPEILQRHTYDGRKTDVWSLGVVLYRMLTGVAPFEGDSIVNVKRQIVSGHFHVPHFMSKEVQKLLRKLLTVNPSQRPTLEDVMKDPWFNKGGKEKLSPYSEPPWGELDPQVIEIMQSLGFKQDDIQESITQRKFDRAMGTYLILKMMRTKMPGRKIRVRPYRSPGTSSMSSSQEVGQPFDKKIKEPFIPPNCLWLRVTTPPPHLETMTTTRPEFRTDTPSADLQLGPADSPTTQSSSSTSTSTSTSSGGGAPVGAAHESCLKAEQPEGDTPAYSSGPIKGQHRVARRAFQFLLRLTCCGSTKKKHLKRTKVKPI